MISDGGVRILVLGVVVLLAVAGCGAGSPGPASAPPSDPFAMTGWWRVTGTGTLVLVDPDRLQVRDGDLWFDGPWRADSDGRFLAGVDAARSVSGGPAPGPDRAPSWIAGTAAVTADGPARVLRDRSGRELARWEPEPAGAQVDLVDPARSPSDQQRSAAGPAAPVPANVRSAGPADLAGRWRPAGFAGPTEPFVTFSGDGTWTGSDGCNGVGGAWTAGADGGFLATASDVMTLIACDGVAVGSQLRDARRAGIERDTLVLFDTAGRELGRYARS